jgi:ABC-type maltose transport system permease subunit
MKRLFIIDLCLIGLLSLVVVGHFLHFINDTMAVLVTIPVMIYFVILQKLIKKKLKSYVKEDFQERAE